MRPTHADYPDSVASLRDDGRPESWPDLANTSTPGGKYSGFDQYVDILSAESFQRFHKVSTNQCESQ
jgi:hypothetical protein